MAHLGYSRDEIVTRRRWLDEAAYADLVALCQFLPGPASSQVGYGLGLMRAGPQPMGLTGALICLAAVFAPGLMLVTGALPFWAALRAWPWARAGMRGANAAVVGVLAAALINPIGTGTITGGVDAALAIAGFALLTLLKWPP